MSKFDPEQGGWHLRDAVMNGPWQDMLALVRQIMEELRARAVSFETPEWWSDNLAPSAASQNLRGASDRALVLGLECNRCAVETWFRDELYKGRLVCWGRPASSRAKYERAPPWAVIGVESWWKGGGILRLESGELFFTARIEPTNTAKKGFARTIFRAWLAEHHAQRRASGTEPTEDDDYRAAKREFPGVSRDVVREERRRILPSTALRPGRRRAAGQ